MRDIYQETTDRFIDMAAQGKIPWEQPWKSMGYSFSLPKNGVTQSMYRGINIPLLEFAAMEKDYALHEWGSYDQWKKAGKQVRRGEKGTKIIFFKELQIGEEEDEKKIPMIRDYSVFNACQLEGYKLVENPKPVVPVERLAHVEEFIRNTGAIIVKGGNENYYNRRTDTIHTIDGDKFVGTKDQTPLQAEYGTTFHELCHWTGAEHRLNRQFGKRFGDKKYAAEEGVAEMGSSFVMAYLGVQPSPSVNSVAYLNGWLPSLLEDKKNIIPVASEASKASDYLIMLQNKEDVTGATLPVPVPVKPQPKLVA